MRSFRTTLGTSTLGAALFLLAPSHARADEPPPAQPAPAASPAGQPPKNNPAGISEEARTHFAAGVSLLQDPEGEKVEEAYREFKTAYDVSGSAKILGNMGFCAMRLERDGEAIEAYSRYLREVPDIDADERAQIVRDLQTLTVGVARLTIEVDKPGVRIIDVRIPVRGERVTNTYGPVTGKLDIGVRPGHHVITAKLPDHDDAMWEVDVFAASKDRNAFTMRPRSVAVAGPSRSDGGGSNVGPWVVMGVGGAMILGGAITGVIALGKTSDISDKCPGDVCPKTFDLEGERSNAKTFVRITDVLLIGGGVVTAGGLAWLLLSRGSTENEPAKAAAHARSKRPFPMPSAGCGPDGCRASMKVVF
ncbi:MAG: hypothetical protein JWP87_1220 [Labilithrix sp.]|nr:hypothetical protein [Labilithrix sp.]